MWGNLRISMPQLRGRVEPHLKGIAESTLAQAFNLFGIIAGYILADSYNVFNQYPWALMIFPGLLSNRGAIGGLFSGRLSTGLHLGTILPKIHKNTGEAYQLYSAVIALTGLSAILIVVGGGVFSLLTYKVELTELFQLFLVVFTTLALSIMVVMPTTFLVSIQAFNRGLDPDMVVYPITSTVADISISYVYVSMLRLIALENIAAIIAMVFITLIFVTGVSLIHSRNKLKREYAGTLSEFIPTLAVVTVIVTLTGYVLGRISERIGDTAEIYTIYPAMIDTVGDVGSIIGSTATTKLSLGFFKAELSSIRGHMSEISYAWSGSLILFTIYAFISNAAHGIKNVSPLFAVVLCTNLLVIPLIAAISFAVGIVTFQRGLNPDNFVIPFETSLADSLTTVILYLMIMAWY